MNFPQLVVIHTVKGSSVVSEAHMHTNTQGRSSLRPLLSCPWAETGLGELLHEGHRKVKCLNLRPGGSSGDFFLPKTGAAIHQC